MTNSADQGPAAAYRSRLLEALLPIAAIRGWTVETVAEAAEAAGLSAGQRDLAAPRGPLDMIEAFARWADEEMIRRLDAAEPLPKSVRERVRMAVWARIEVLAPHKPAEAKAVQALVRPLRIMPGAGNLWRTADLIWRRLGDSSTDENWYSKRAILSGVIGAVMLRWFADESPGAADTKAFLDHRIEGVIRFEKIKASLKPVGAWAEMAVATAARAVGPKAPPAPGADAVNS